MSDRVTGPWGSSLKVKMNERGITITPVEGPGAEIRGAAHKVIQISTGVGKLVTREDRGPDGSRGGPIKGVSV